MMALCEDCVQKCGISNTLPTVHRYVNLFHKHELDGKVVCQMCGHRHACLLCPEEDDNHSACPYCGAVVLNKYLKRHINVHVGRRDYKCCRCLKAFKRKDTLLEHLRMHDNIRPYSCLLCPKAFNTSSKLRKHENSFHGIPGRKFVCNECGAGAVFKWASSLSTHLKTKHMVKEPYVCSYCKEKFSTLQKLMTHEEEHLRDVDTLLLNELAINSSSNT